MEHFPQFSQDGNVFVKIGELFANFDKSILILRGFGKVFCLFSCFSHDFCQCVSMCVCTSSPAAIMILTIINALNFFPLLYSGGGSWMPFMHLVLFWGLHQTHSLHLENHGKISGNTQNFPEIFLRFFPVHVHCLCDRGS